MLVWIVVLVALVILAVLAMAASKPSTFSVVREVEITAPSSDLHALINDFHAWSQWSRGRSWIRT
jgi:cytochrome b561